jgi:hypothetical protein
VKIKNRNRVSIIIEFTLLNQKNKKINVKFVKISGKSKNIIIIKLLYNFKIFYDNINFIQKIFFV